MLSYFPVPYPDELWYGVITRYHVHSGGICWSDTLKGLFGCEKAHPCIGNLLPNETMQQIATQMPQDRIDLKDLALNHSLFSFQMRFQPGEKKREYLKHFIAGENMQPKFLIYTKKLREERPLRYCPVCCKEEIAKYGEPYWHTEHQIWLLPLCPVHGCHLIESSRKRSMPIGQQLLLPPLEPDRPDYTSSEIEQSLTESIHYLYQLPYDEEPAVDTDNLSRAVENAKLLEPGSIKRRAWDTQRLYDLLIEVFGESVVTDYFGRHITRAHALRLRKYEIYATEEYVMLMVSLRIKADVLFARTAIPLALEEQMRKLSLSGSTFTKPRAARALGIREDQLLPYAKRFGIQPFWVQSGKACDDRERQTYTIQINLSQREREELDAYMEAHDMDVYGHALRFFMKREIERWERSQKRK